MNQETRYSSEVDGFVQPVVATEKLDIVYHKHHQRMLILIREFTIVILLYTKILQGVWK